MDGLKTKKKLYAGLGDFARQTRAGQMKAKYGTGSPELDAAAAKQDEAVESAGLPKGNTNGKGFSITVGLGDVARDADKWQSENDAALEELAEDEEMAKWTRKQRG